MTEITEMMYADIQVAIDALVPLMTEKGITRPECEFCIKSESTTRVFLKGKGIRPGVPGYDLKGFPSLDEAEAYLRGMPDPETAAKQEWHRKLGDLIGDAFVLDLPLEVTTPLRQSSQAMTENLLPAPEGEGMSNTKSHAVSFKLKHRIKGGWGKKLLPRFAYTARGDKLQLHATKGWRKAC